MSISSQSDPIPEWRIAMIDLFMSAAQLIGYPKSVGQIYGYLYSAFEPTPMDRIISDLKISKGSVSQGLTLLRQLGAVRTQLILGDRRDHFVAENKSKKLISGLLKTRLIPHLEEGEDKINDLEWMLEEESDEIRASSAPKIAKLKRWHSRLKTILPVLHKVIDRV